MKRNALIIAALLVSGAAFAQEKPVTVTAQASSSIAVKKGSTAGGNTTQVSASQEGQATADLQPIQTAAVGAHNKIANTANAGISTTNEVAVNTTAVVNQQVKAAARTSGKAATIVNTSVSKSINIQSAPLKVNTRIVGATGLRVL